MKNSTYLRPLITESMTDRVINRIIGMIVSGEYKPGSKIPTESELCLYLGVGRNSIRESIKVLEYLGVLEIKRAEGTFVRTETSEKMLNPLLFGIILEGDSSNNILELRKIFDIGSLELAIKKISPADEKNIEDKFEILANEISKENVDIDKLLEADISFHESISDILNNKLVKHVNSVITKLTIISRKETFQRISLSSSKKKQSLERHRNILKCIKEKNSAGIYQIIEESYEDWSIDLQQN